MICNKLAKGGLLAALAGTAIATAIPAPSFASSHREAPFITRLPKVDATDFYMFRSYAAGRSAFVTFLANYIPLQGPGDGPNYYTMDPDALYEIHIDNNGSGIEDITFQFRFTNTNKDTKLAIGGKMVSIPLRQSGAISGVNPGSLNERETYTVQVVRGGRRSGTRADVSNVSGGATTFDKPVDNIGNKTIANYAAYAALHIYDINIPGCSTAGRMFVGQRKDTFVVNLGETFDLINIAVPAVQLGAGAESAELDSLRDKNVTTIALEVPISCLVAGSETVIGGWTTASVRQGRLINPFLSGSTTTTASREGGPWAQVSRLSNPLVNEVVIGLKDKDRFNASKPTGDAQFLDYVTNPTLPALVELLFSSAGVRAPTKFPRQDLVVAFLTGIPGTNQPSNVVASEMIRLNTGTAAVAKGSQNRLGVIGGDAAGFPNGRRPGDDVVDIALRVVMGRLCILNNATVFGCVPADAPSGSLDFTDGAFTSDANFDDTFPYARTPLPGSPAN